MHPPGRGPGTRRVLKRRSSGQPHGKETPQRARPEPPAGPSPCDHTSVGVRGGEAPEMLATTYVAQWAASRANGLAARYPIEPTISS